MAKMHHIPLEKDEREPFIFNKMRQFLDNLPKSFPSEKKNVIYKRYFESKKNYKNEFYSIFVSLL